MVAVLKDSLSGCDENIPPVSRKEAMLATLGDKGNENSTHLDPESLSRNGHGYGVDVPDQTEAERERVQLQTGSSITSFSDLRGGVESCRTKDGVTRCPGHTDDFFFGVFNGLSSPACAQSDEGLIIGCYHFSVFA